MCLFWCEWDCVYGVCATNMTVYLLLGGNEMETSWFSVIITENYLTMMTINLFQPSKRIRHKIKNLPQCINEIIINIQMKVIMNLYHR